MLWAPGAQAHRLVAVDRAVNRKLPQESNEPGLSLRRDNGYQPTSLAFMKPGQAFTRYNNPKGNADTERLMRTLKQEFLWLREWTSVLERESALATWIE